jgi:hypothetical protein
MKLSASALLSASLRVKADAHGAHTHRGSNELETRSYQVMGADEHTLVLDEHGKVGKMTLVEFPDYSRLPLRI